MTDSWRALNRVSRKQRTSSIGLATRRSQATNSAPSTAARRSEPTIIGSVQPRDGTSMIPNTSATSPPTERIAPIGSSGDVARRPDSGTMRGSRRYPTTTNGTLTRNTEHQANLSTDPAEDRPDDDAQRPTPPQAAIALGRSSGGKALAMIDSVDGIASAAAEAHEPREQR